MELIVRRGEREERVRLRHVEGGYEIELAGRSYQIESVALGADLYSLRLDGAHHEAAVLPRSPQGENTYWVSVGQTAGTVEVLDPLTHLASQGAAAQGGKRHRKVTAYMPGRVVAVLATEGEEIAAGQGVVVLEAMKMQNEIQAEVTGTLARIFVQPGQAVEAGDPLFELE